MCYNQNIGTTEPKFAILDDGKQVVAKLMNGPEGNLVLFNEYLCYRLAILVDIPMPVSGICIFDDTTIIQNPDIADSSNYGKAFYSEYIQKTTKLLPTIIEKIKNKNDFIKLILFDHIIFNSDRNAGNLLVSFYSNDILLKVIDHTHVFVNQSIWDGNCLISAMAENDLLSTKVLEYNKYLYEMFFHNISITKESLENEASLFQKRINKNKIMQFIKDVPNEWKPKENDIQVLVDYLMYRIDNIDTIIATIIRYIQ